MSSVAYFQGGPFDLTKRMLQDDIPPNTIYFAIAEPLSVVVPEGVTAPSCKKAVYGAVGGYTDVYGIKSVTYQFMDIIR